MAAFAALFDARVGHEVILRRMVVLSSFCTRVSSGQQLMTDTALLASSGSKGTQVDLHSSQVKRRRNCGKEMCCVNCWYGTPSVLKTLARHEERVGWVCSSTIGDEVGA